MAIALERDTPVEAYRRRRFWRWVLAALTLLAVLGSYAFWRIVPEAPERHADIQEHFKYGSIGADNTDRGVPYWMWKVLPELFPEHLPDGGTDGYASLGFVVEPGHDRPIGFSQRRVQGIDLVGLNCAACHAGSYRDGPTGPRQIVLGMPSNTVNLQAYFEFLFNCAGDERYGVGLIMDRIRKYTDLGLYDSIAYPIAIRAFREKALALRDKLEYANHIPRFGPGRVDTFTPYKRLLFGLPPGDAIGTTDFPTLWHQRQRRTMNLHWDGNNDLVEERNISAAIGAGVRPTKPTTLDEPAMKRIMDWILDFGPPAFPKPIDSAKADAGKGLFAKHCYDCHAFDGKKVGQVDPIEFIKTDRNRLDSFDAEMVEKMNTLGKGYPWHFSHFKKTNGYANMPLDGVWLRAPYLHNGSVPTLRDLLTAPEKRPAKFYRGGDVYDWTNVGFYGNDPASGGRNSFRFDTAEKGNGNGGHLYGTELSDADKDALIEFLKTL